jgi:hypothetical protein
MVVQGIIDPDEYHVFKPLPEKPDTRPIAILINTARGSIFETETLSNGKIAAAGLNVLPWEPVVREEADLLRSCFTREHGLDTLLAEPHPAQDAQRGDHPAHRLQHAQVAADPRPHTREHRGLRPGRGAEPGLVLRSTARPRPELRPSIQSGEA